jgi:hypothetical protein
MARCPPAVASTILGGSPWQTWRCGLLPGCNFPTYCTAPAPQRRHAQPALVPAQFYFRWPSLPLVTAWGAPTQHYRKRTSLCSS